MYETERSQVFGKEFEKTRIRYPKVTETTVASDYKIRMTRGDSR